MISIIKYHICKQILDTHFPLNKPNITINKCMHASYVTWMLMAKRHTMDKIPVAKRDMWFPDACIIYIARLYTVYAYFI